MVLNQGSATAGASTIRYYLSLDQVRDGADLQLGGQRNVLGIPSGSGSSGSAAVTVPPNVPVDEYYLISCADDLDAVAELDETNNCTASAATLFVTLPDLVISSVTDPPSAAGGGDIFSVSDTVLNQGTADSGGSTTRFYLSLDMNKDAGDVGLTGARGLSGLAPGASNNGTINVGVPFGIVAGTYYLLACADDSGFVTESDELNNCSASAQTVAVP